MTTYVRVKVRRTGHQIDIVDSHYDPERHELVKRMPAVKTPRRPKHKVRYTAKTSAPKAVEAPGLPIEAGTVEEEVGP